MMGFYTKRPVTIEAMQWDGSPEGATPIINWILANGGTARYSSLNYGSIHIDTPEGTMIARPYFNHWHGGGDWIIRGVQGEFYPCKPDVFEQTYEPEPTAPPSLTKTRTLMESMSGGCLYVTPEDDDDRRGHRLLLDADIFEDMGRPKTITVTIEPGDRLNGDPQ